MYCTNCGEKIADGATFCSKCGTKVIIEQIASVKATQKTEEEIYANRPHKGPQSTSYRPTSSVTSSFSNPRFLMNLIESFRYENRLTAEDEILFR